jgi:uncharacterized protein YndB with AHSA1/START domain
MSTSYTATVFIEAVPDRVFEYVRVPENQPSWAVNFALSTRPLSDGRYVMRTPFGEMVYRVEAEPRCRTVDFVFEAPGGENVLPTRVVPHGSGAVFTFTIHRVPGMSDVEWEGGGGGSTRSLRS